MSFLLLPLKFILVALDFAITLVTFGWINAIKNLFTPEPMRSVPVADDEAYRVNTKHKGNLLKTPIEGVLTLHDIAQYSFKKFADRPAMGQREFLGQLSPKVKKFGDVTFRTYDEVKDMSLKFGASLRAAGLVASEDVCTLDQITTSSSIAIFENTCPEWMISALGAFSQSISVTTIYATLGSDAVVEAIVAGNIRAIVCNKKNVALLLDKIGEMPTLKHIIYTNDMVAPGDDISIPDGPDDVKVASFDEFVNSGDTKAFAPVAPKPSTCAVIMYTSGSTGKPKGVVLTHENVTSTATMVTDMLNEEDVYLGYLPLAHILELTAEVSAISLGCCICYADPKTLTATGASPMGALEQYKPTVMVGVPKIWDIIKKGVQAKIAGSSPVAKFLVNTAFETRERAISWGFDTPLFKALVFKKFSKVVGGRLRLALSGGGPLNSDVQVFIRTCFGVPLVQGYGLTETCAGLTIQAEDDLRAGVAGVPIPTLEVKLVSCPEINDKAGLAYLSTDRKDVKGDPIFGRGEVQVKGANIGMGYYMMEDKTKEDFDDDGFFHTGDIGQFASDGSLQIVDRKKNLVKLHGGEYIALENMEMVYGNCKFVDAAAGGITCYGDGAMDRPIALMQLNEVVMMNWAKENSVEGDSGKIKDSKDFYDAVMKEMEAEHKKAGLSHLEKLIAIAFITDPWTPENGCLTAANKLQRRRVIEVHDQVFQETRKKGIF